MPPKKRQSFQSRNKLARSRESSPEREARRTADRDRGMACVRTSQHGALQQEADRKRKADALENESTQHRAVRQQHNRTQMIFSRGANACSSAQPDSWAIVYKRHTPVQLSLCSSARLGNRPTVHKRHSHVQQSPRSSAQLGNRPTVHRWHAPEACHGLTRRKPPSTMTQPLTMLRMRPSR